MFFLDNQQGEDLSKKLLISAGDSLNRAIQELISEKEYHLKHVILLTFHSVALIFKARLAKFHPLLIYSNLDRPVTTNSRTVEFLDSIGRLENCGVRFKPQDKKYLQGFHGFRNRVEHFIPDLENEEVTNHLIRVYQFIHFFLNKELHKNIKGFLGKTEQNHLLQFAHDYDKKVKMIKTKIAQDFSSISPKEIFNNQCRKCGLEFLYFTKKDISKSAKCYFCGFKHQIRSCDECDNPTIHGICYPCADRIFPDYDDE